jgi:hypothetical protein
VQGLACNDEEFGCKVGVDCAAQTKELVCVFDRFARGRGEGIELVAGDLDAPAAVWVGAGIAS